MNTTTNTNTNISIVVAMDSKHGIGYKNTIPWHNREDFKYFKELTENKQYFKNAVVMGRKTYESIGRALPNRLNIVISTNLAERNKYSNDVEKGLVYVKDPDSAIGFCNTYNIDNIFIIGGSSIYEHFMDKATNIYITHQLHTYVCDVFFPYAKFSEQNKVVVSSKPLLENNECSAIVVHYRITKDAKVANTDEYQYLDLVKNILLNGLTKPNRTDHSSVSIFGHNSKWSLKDLQFPLLTTKKVFFRAVVEELLWFISGSTNSKLLENKGINIWKGNTTRDFLDKRGLQHLEEGDIGAGYGFQWRHSGAEYSGHVVDYTGKGVDQLQELIDTIKKDPNSRRMIMCSWNPSALSSMALPPCHVMFQVYCENSEGKKSILHSILYQRSADVGLGVPFNIASYALLTIILAHCCDMEPGTFTYYTGDTHIYSNHITAMKKQMFRVPRKMPILKIKSESKNIYDLKYEDFILENYDPYDSIKMDMAV